MHRPVCNNNTLKQPIARTVPNCIYCSSTVCSVQCAVCCVTSLWCAVYRLCGVLHTVSVLCCILFLWCAVYRLCGVLCTVSVVCCILSLWCAVYRLYGVLCTVSVVCWILSLWCAGHCALSAVCCVLKHMQSTHKALAHPKVLLHKQLEPLWL